VTKVALGEADAGIGYVTDVVAAGDAVSSVEIPEEDNVVARYPIAVLDEAPNERLAEDFVALVLSEDGTRTLTEAGFGIP
jgi:molybdate transport system substrate-binding protein